VMGAHANFPAKFSSITRAETRLRLDSHVKPALQGTLKKNSSTVGDDVSYLHTVKKEIKLMAKKQEESLLFNLEKVITLACDVYGRKTSRFFRLVYY
jgi:hypothetical protein